VDEGAAPPSDEWDVITWQGLGEICDRLGREADGAQWRTTAAQPAAPAMWRFLAELVEYLEKEGLAVIEAVDKRSVDVFRDAATSMTRIEMLLQQAAEQTGFSLWDEMGGHDDWSALWQCFHADRDSWLLRRLAPLELEGWSELSLWAQGVLDGPAVAAGYTLPGALHQALSTNEDFVLRANSAGFRVDEWDQCARVMRVKALDTFVEAEDSLVRQAELVADFARRAITEAAGLDPGELARPPSRAHAARHDSPPSPRGASR
jgi:hypothetical protein